MTFAEKRAARAARFGIPFVEPKKPQTPKKRQQNDHKGSNKKQKKGDNKQQGEKQQKKNTPKKKEMPPLSVEEIEKRLKRAEKFGTGDNAQTQELKAMLRKHRFAAGSSTS
jgi:SAP domain-containing ribonucleoprotein